MAAEALLQPFARGSPEKFSGGGSFIFVEVQKYNDDDHVGSPVISSGTLLEDQVADWAWRRGQYKHIPSTSLPRRLEGGIRLLCAQPEGTDQFSVPEVLSSRYGDILAALNLPSCAFTSYSLASGAYSVHTVPDGTTVANCKKLSIIMRLPQRRQCSLGGLAMTHDFETGITTALIITYAFDLNLSLTGYGTVPLSELIDHLKVCRAGWTHPLLLPTLYIVMHSRAVRRYIVDDINEEVRTLEHQIGVVRTYHGQTRDVSDRLFVNGIFQRGRAARLVQAVNEISTSIIYAQRSPVYQLNALAFLTDLLRQHERLPSQGFQETFDFLRGYCEATLEVTQSGEARMKLQLNILYTSIAQDDGQTSARIAASAGKDSTSMKIIALITAAYLPATFVATLFSSGMFDWKSSETGTVSRSFWVYWAVAIPLTILTLTGWAMWWTHEKRQFEKQIQHVVRGADKRSDLSLGKSEKWA